MTLEVMFFEVNNDQNCKRIALEQLKDSNTVPKANRSMRLLFIERVMRTQDEKHQTKMK